MEKNISVEEFARLYPATFKDMIEDVYASQQDIDPEFNDIVNENFNDLID